MASERERFGLWRTGAAVLLCLTLGAGVLWANPAGESVVAGSVEFDRTPDTLTVNQASDRAIINWRDFSIDAGELTRFVQPGSWAAALNRVVSGNPSAIYGTLLANGQVYLINPNGIVVGPGGVIDVHSFVASTLGVQDSDFLDGGALNFTGDSSAGILNLGSIGALGGDVFLIAPVVRNDGSITAEEGTVGLAAGRSVLLADGAAERLFVRPAAPGENAGASGVENTGAIEAARAELQAAGGNLYALAINNEGIVRATEAVKENGRVLLRAGDGGTVRHAGTIRTDGGTVSVTGGEVRLEDGSVIDASGRKGGGTVEVGGSFRGQGPLANSERTVVAEGAAVRADGPNGDGGRVVVWSDGDTEFRGTATATAGGRRGVGGLVEVSGRESLLFDGYVSTLADSGLTGLLLIDPQNVVVADSGGDISPAAIAAALGTNHLVVHTTNPDASDIGQIVINSPVDYSSANSLTFLAHSSIQARASVQNDGAGALNLVSGWDGVTAAPGGIAPSTTLGAPFDIGAILANPSSYGNNEEAVRIMGGYWESGVAVGSRDGPTTVAGFVVDLDGHNEIGTGYAQIGYRAHSLVEGGATGPITVRARHTIDLDGGVATTSYAQIGHGGADLGTGPEPDGSFSGDIDLAADLGFNMRARGSSSYAQIGHGGSLSNGDHTGAIDLQATGPVVLLGSTQGGSSGAYVQIGHGGYQAGAGPVGDHVGDITVTTGNDLELAGGDGPDNYVQIGHGGTDADGNHQGDVTVDVTRDVLMHGGAGLRSYAQIGHGGANTDGNLSGHTTVDIDDDLYVQGGFDEAAYVQIGHGAHQNAGSGERLGKVYAASGDGMTLIPYNGGYWIGHRSGDSLPYDDRRGVLIKTGLLTADILPGSLAINSEGFRDMVMADLGLGNVSLVAIQPTEGDAGLEVAIPMLYEATGDLSLVSVAGVDVDASVQNAGDGDVNAVAGWDGVTGVSMPAGLTSPSQAMFRPGELAATPGSYGNNGGSVAVGDGTQTEGIALGSRHGATNVYAHDLTLRGGNVQDYIDAFAQVGFRTHSQGEGLAATGDVTARLTGRFHGQGGDTYRSYVQVGHGGYDPVYLRNGAEIDGDYSGNIRITSTEEIRMAAGRQGGSAYAQVGHGGQGQDGAHSGVAVVQSNQGDVIFDAGHTSAYAQLGHGGIFSSGQRSGSVGMWADGNAVFSGGDSEAYAQMGHGGLGSEGQFSGSVTASAGGGLIFEGGSDYAYAQLGHGGLVETEITASGDVTASAGLGFLFLGGSGYDAYTQLGHGGIGAAGNLSGSIGVNPGYRLDAPDGEPIGEMVLDSYLAFRAGAESRAYAQLGHGGYGAGSGEHSGVITVNAGPDEYITGEPTGSGPQVLQQNGPELTAVEFTAGGYYSYAQLGHGGFEVLGDSAGNITLRTQGLVPDGITPQDVSTGTDVVFTGGSGSVSYAQLGHGGAAYSGLLEGDIDVLTDGVVKFLGGTGYYAYAMLGHGGLLMEYDPVGDITVEQPLELHLIGGDGTGAHAVIGHAGAAECLAEGHIYLDVADTTYLANGSDGVSNWYVGHLDCQVLEQSDTTLLTGRLVEDGNDPGPGNAANINDADLVRMLQENLYRGDTTLGLSSGGNLLLGDPVVAETPYTLILATTGNFINSAGSEALNIMGGRWLVYSHDPYMDVRDGLEGAQQFLSPFFPEPTAPLFEGDGYLYIVGPRPPEEPKGVVLPAQATNSYDDFERHWRQVVEDLRVQVMDEMDGDIFYGEDVTDFFEWAWSRLSSFQVFHQGQE